MPWIITIFLLHHMPTDSFFPAGISKWSNTRQHKELFQCILTNYHRYKTNTNILLRDSKPNWILCNHKNIHSLSSFFREWGNYSVSHASVFSERIEHESSACYYQSAEGIWRPDTLTHTRVPIYYINAIKKDNNNNLKPKYRFSL